MATFNKKNRLVSLAIIMLVLLMGFSLQLLIGNVFYYQGQRLVQEAQISQEPQQKQANIAQALSLLDKAIWFDEQADYLELKASLLIWQSRQQQPVNMQKIQQAITLYQQALYKRPSWPYAWLGIVEANIISEQFNNNLEHAIKQTVNLGFYEALIQKQLLQLTLPVYRKLSLEGRQAVFSMYQQALKANNQTLKLIALGNEASVFPLFCILQKEQITSFHPAIAKNCKLILETKKGSKELPIR